MLLDSEADADGENGPTWGHLLADELNSIRAHLTIDHPRGPHVSTNIDTDYSADYWFNWGRQLEILIYYFWN